MSTQIFPSISENIKCISKNIGYITVFEMVLFSIATAQVTPLYCYFGWILIFCICFFLLRVLNYKRFSTDNNKQTRFFCSDDEIIDDTTNPLEIFFGKNYDILFNINLTTSTIIYIFMSLYTYNIKYNTNIINTTGPIFAIIICSVLAVYAVGICWKNQLVAFIEICLYNTIATIYAYLCYICTNGKSVYLNNMFVVNGEVCTMNKQQSMKCQLRSNSTSSTSKSNTTF